MNLTMILSLAFVALAFILCRWVRRALRRVPAYVISVPDGSRPRCEVAARLASGGIDPTFVDAVDGRRVTDTSQFSTSYKWGPGQIGCALSHMRLWQALDTTEALIMEDDAIPVPEFAAVLHDIWGELDETIDIVFLGHCFETRGRRWKGSARLRTSVVPRCTHAYFVTKAGMTKLAAWARHAVVSLPIDEEIALLCKSGDLTCISVFPQLARQDWQPS